MIEHNLKDQIFPSILGLISPPQYVLRRGHNTTNLLLSLTGSIRSDINKGLPTLLAALDLSKAFNSVNQCLQTIFIRGRYLSGDDCKKPDILESNINDSFGQLFEWSHVNSLLINPSKSKDRRFGNVNQSRAQINFLIVYSSIEIVSLHKCLTINSPLQNILISFMATLWIPCTHFIPIMLICHNQLLTHALLMPQILYGLEAIPDNAAYVFSRLSRILSSVARYSQKLVM